MPEHIAWIILLGMGSAAVIIPLGLYIFNRLINLERGKRNEQNSRELINNDREEGPKL